MLRRLLAAMLLLNGSNVWAQSAPQAPPPALPQSSAAPPVDFERDIKPIFVASCIRCHARGKARGGFSMDNRDALLAGGDSGLAVVPGRSGESRLIALVDGTDPDEVMPKKGSRLKPEQIARLRTWIDQGVPWDARVTFARAAPRNLTPRYPSVPAETAEVSHPIDRILAPYLARAGVSTRLVDDRVFARRAYFDVIGVPPPSDELRAFIADRRTNKRERLVARLLADRKRYAEHWISFWNDVLRNDYRGPGYIDGGRTQISAWLYAALVNNVPYDRFVRELVNPPAADSAGFTKGIIWRGVVNASQTPEMQAAQNISQVFMGVNLKCASCHDSFINEWQLADAYGLAGIYAEGPLQMVECDRPLDESAPLKFIYPELGAIDATAPRAKRVAQLASILTDARNGRLSRTIVNRLWARFMGRGLVEPVDDMEQAPWHPDLLDWLAEDLVANGYDLQQTIARILTSNAYRMVAVDEAEPARAFVFRGPSVRRLTAEQFVDALGSITGVWHAEPAGDFDFRVAPNEAPPAAKGQWIRAAASQTTPWGPVSFRTSFTLPQVPALAQLLIASDRGYVLHVNARKVGDYRAAAMPRLVGIGSFLQAGTNTLAIVALPRSTPPAVVVTSVLPPRSDPPALFVELIARSDREAPLSVVAASDMTWQAAAAPAEGWERASAPRLDWPAAVAAPSPANADALLARARATATLHGETRSSLTVADPLMLALGRPTREQVITIRASAATTLQLLELNNGSTLARTLADGAARLLAEGSANAQSIVERVYERALGREPTKEEMRLSRELLGKPVKRDGVEDLLWGVIMLPEFQLIR
jgi:mono/diheme cytochrome c family protein